MKRKMDLFEVFIVLGCLIFTVVISLYHLSDEGYLGLSARFWKVEWSVSENGLLLFMTWIIASLTFGILRNTFLYILMPYFTLKIIY